MKLRRWLITGIHRKHFMLAFGALLSTVIYFEVRKLEYVHSEAGEKVFAMVSYRLSEKRFGDDTSEENNIGFHDEARPKQDGTDLLNYESTYGRMLSLPTTSYRKSSQNTRSSESGSMKSVASKAGKLSLCGNVVKDRPNWTVIFKKETPNHCYRHKYSKWVKRIIFQNKTMIYRGCTSKTRKCGYRPYFDKQLNARINAPPCCLRHVIEIFRNVADLMGKYGGRYFLFGGGLIGWYRSHSIVPYDHDIDLIVDLNFWRSRQFQEMLKALKRDKGYFIRKMSWNKIKIYLSKLNHNFIDMWPYTRKGKERVRIKSSQWKGHNVSHVLPLRKTTFEGFKIWVPRDPAAMLEVEYGTGWRQELSCKKVGKFGNCKS